MNNAPLSYEDTRAIIVAASRFVLMAKSYNMENLPSMADVAIAITTAHRHGCPMRLNHLAIAETDDLLHDVGGILRHLDRNTGKVGGLFVPRYAAVEGSP